MQIIKGTINWCIHAEHVSFTMYELCGLLTEKKDSNQSLSLIREI